jgi:hypothetical protein
MEIENVYCAIKYSWVKNNSLKKILKNKYKKKNKKFKKKYKKINIKKLIRI